MISYAKGAYYSIKDILHTSNNDFKYIINIIILMFINQ